MKNYYFDKEDMEIRAEQGHIVQMESVITVTATKCNGSIGVTIGGEGGVLSLGWLFVSLLKLIQVTESESDKLSLMPVAEC